MFAGIALLRGLVHGGIGSSEIVRNAFNGAAFPTYLLLFFSPLDPTLLAPIARAPIFIGLAGMMGLVYSITSVVRFR